MDEDSKDIGIITDRVAETTCSKCGCKIDVEGLEPFMAVECPDCSSIENVPAKLGQFLLLNLIGKGGMGGVYYAEDTSLGRHVAIKVMLQSLGDNKEFVETFKREAQAVAKLNHPNIVQIYAFGKEKGQPYIVMELVGGQRLDKMMEGGIQVDQALVMKTALDVAEALKAADEIGLIHGDIKPENILMDEKGQSKLVDFGLATFAHQASPEGIWGTPYYIAPEKIKRQPVDARSDIYSLGATIYHSLTGRPPFEGTTPIDVVKARLERDPEPVHFFCPKIDPLVESIVSRMLQRHPSRRYPNYPSLISDLKKAVQTLGPVKSATQGIGKVKQTLIVPKNRTSSISVDAGKGAKAKGDIPEPRATQSGSPRPTSSPRPTTGKHKAATFSPDSYSQKLQKSIAAPKEKGAGPKIKIPKWVYVIIVLILAIVGISSLVSKKMREKEELRNRRLENITLTKEKAVTEMTFGAIDLAVTNINRIAQGAEACITKATNAVFVITGEHLPRPVFKPKEVPVEPADQAEPTTNGVVVSSTNGTAGVSNAVGSVSNAIGSVSNAVGGATNAAVAVASAGKASTNAPAAHEAPAKGAAPKSAVQAKHKPVKVVEEEIPANEPEIKTLARKIFKEAMKITEKTREAATQEEVSTAFKDKTMKEASSSLVSERNKELQLHLASIQAIETEVKIMLGECEKDAAKAEGLKTAFEEEQKIKTQNAEKEAKEKAAAAAKERSEKERLNLIENEKKLVETARNNCVYLIKSFNFKGALDSTSGQVASFQTDEGKAAIKALVDRYSYLNKMKLFLIEQLTATSFQWGWLNPSQDIIGADLVGVKIRGRTIAWPDIGPGQMLRIIDHCLANKEVPYKTRAEHTLATAIYCYEMGGLDAAKRYITQAIDISVTMKDESARVLPLAEMNFVQ